LNSRRGKETDIEVVFSGSGSKIEIIGSFSLDPILNAIWFQGKIDF
jgi:hypothetical protein